ncbi:ANL family adenylate-forming protein [Marinomonas mediterranea]|uniref:AMP-dependent synthetase and ligase n=1 Tax=Marinomonas mediterranea (strain ATCC 700492 / JCM 21426 / NBRC 103028 / MMB-1) TaxID=717774 RepID=F2JXQ4_MARM1|nr:fatty acid--CoA ligase family protein [Marinomonas mediterranea]ADZ93052.1 AMP-dependent synthetase and ligase [Marinomonas mediterranea MMB-1]WCN10960.1 AMP-binding protein [Marinomonas mediterranea]WCN15022.1 AMP-binding protein [Marinomonas mediterranea]WCN19066.1 AMP-binding protein [Marinomonas mediterranea MMB-1]
MTVFKTCTNDSSCYIDVDELTYNFGVEIKEFVLQLSQSFRLYAEQGTLAIDKVDIDNARILMISAWFAGWKVAVIPENKLADQKKTMVSDLQADILITGQSASGYKGASSQSFLHLVVESDESEPKHYEQDFFLWFSEQTKRIFELATESYRWAPNSPALVLFTSGTTGKPKGVLISIQSLCHLAENFTRHFNITKDDRLLSTAALHTISGIRNSIFIPLMYGTEVIAPQCTFSVNSVMDLMINDSPSIIFSGPKFIHLMAAIGERETDSAPSLRFVINGSSRMDHQHKLQVEKHFNVPVYNTYGSTEAIGTVLAENLHERALNLGLGGKAFGDMTLKVLDENGVEQDTGEGELRIYSNYLFLGYLGKEGVKPTYIDTQDIVEINEDGYVSWKYRLSNRIKGDSGDWIFSEHVNQCLQQYSCVSDLNTTLIYSEAGVPSFQVEVSIDGLIDGELWKKEAYSRLIIELGNDYKRTELIIVKDIVRSNLGKFEHSIK